jgi:aminoglycoside phosphotransferase (APT) family kinase protein
MTAQTLLEWINHQHQVHFQLLGKLSGGRQDGAELLLDRQNGTQAVLKRAFAPHAAEVIQQLGLRGYPTPAVVCAGETPAGEQYLVLSFARGSPMPRLTIGYVEQIVALNRLQADSNPDPTNRQGSWSDYATSVVFANESGWMAQLRDYSSASKALVAAIDALIAPYHDLVLSNSDSVHGDFNRDNILVVDGQISAVIDTSFAGYGTRMIDLASLLHFAYVHDDGAAVRQRLHAELIAIGGRGGQCICLAYRSITMAGWALAHLPPAAQTDFIRAGWRIVRDLQ